MTRGREPERSCVACRTRRPKEALLRVARSRDGIVRADPSARAPGRGAYVCRDPRCVGDAVGRGALARALRVSLGPEDLATLREAMEKEIEAS
jgi:uncharacterized protein